MKIRIPEYGFPTDDLIKNLLNVKHSDKHEEGKKSFEKIRYLLNITLKRNNEIFIYDYFKNVELDIELEREELLMNIMMI